MQSGKRISQSASGREPRHLLVISLFTSSSYVSGPWSPMEIIDTLRSLADDVENNRVEDTDAVERVRVLGDRIDDLSSLVGFDASVVNTKISQVLQALGAKHRVGRPTVSTHSSPTKLSNLAPSYLWDLLQEYTPSRSLRSTSAGLLCIPTSRLITNGCPVIQLWRYPWRQ